MQSDICKGLDESCYQWVRYNKQTKKLSGIINMQKQMVETSAWKKSRVSGRKGEA